MKNNLITVLGQRYSNRRRHQRRQKWISFVACILVFCITYLALLPAVAQMAPYISKVFKNPGEPVYDYTPAGDNSSYTEYNYADDDINVRVLLPADSNVPKNAILRVTPIGEDVANYSNLVKSAKDVVDGNVKQMKFYDLSFFTDKQVYIPVDDRAIVTINYRNPTIDPNAEIVVLHYDKNDEKPVTLDKVSFIEQPVTSEQELIFETHGFSVFAVVEIETGTYVTTVLKNAEVSNENLNNLGGRTFVITPGINYSGSRYALTNEEVTIHEYNDGGYHEYDRLKAGAVVYTNTTVITPADDGYLWEFIKVAGEDRTYYIRSVETGEYLHIGPGNIIGTTSDPHKILISYKDQQGDNGRVVFSDKENGRHLKCFSTDGNPVEEGIKVFSTGLGDGWDEMFLAEYIQGASESDEDFTVSQWPLNDRMFVVSRQLGGNNTAVLTHTEIVDPAQNSTTKLLQAVSTQAVLDANGYIANIFLDNPNNSVWKFIAVKGKSNTYHIQAADGSGYLNINSNHDLTVENTPQEILLYPTNYGNTVAFRNGNDYVHLYGNDLNRGFGCWNDYDSECYLTLTEYIELGDGGQFVISIPVANTNTVSVLTSNQITDPHPDSTTPVMAGVAKAADNYGNVDISQIDNTSVWNFIPVAGKQNIYHIQSVATNQYLQVHGTDGSNALTTTATPQEIEVVSLGNRLALKLPNTDYYVHWQQFTGDANRGFATWGGLNLGETHLMLTKYTSEIKQDKLITNLAGQSYLICAVNGGESVVTDIEKAFKDGNLDRLGLETIAAGAANGIILNGDGTFSVENYSNMVWKFIGTDTPGQYYIRSQSAANGGKYLHLDQAGVTLSDTPQAIEVVAGTNTGTWTNVVCLRVNDANGTHYLNLCRNDPALGATTYAAAGTDNYGNHFILAQLSESEMAAIEKVIDLIDSLPNQEALVQSSRDNLRELQNDIVDDAAKAIAAYKDLSDAQKLFIGAERVSKLEELDEWLVSENANGEIVARLPNIVDSDKASGVTVKVFNYTSAVKDEQFYKDGFRFFSLLGNHVDGDGDWTGYVNTLNEQVTFKLNAAGYPVLVDRRTGKEVDLSNLFNGTYQQGVMSDGGGLFRQDENGYYFYYSDMNAAYYDAAKNQFVLYDTIVRPSNIWWTSGNDNADVLSDRRSNFLPFNALINSNGTTNIIYDSAKHQAENPTDMESKHDLELIDEPNQVPTAVLDAPTDLWLGLNVEYDFLMPEDGLVDGEEMIFDFHGDDDVWVFIDGVLILDIGGTHAAWDGYINFGTGEVYTKKNEEKTTTLKQLFMDAAGVSDPSVTSVTITLPDGSNKVIRFNGDTLADYSTHNLKFFYMERGGSISYCGLKFNLVPLPEKSLAVTKTVSTEEGEKVNDQTYYTFRILQAHDKNGDGRLDPFLNAELTEFEIWEGGPTGNYGYIDPVTGMFSLKAGQTAVFTGLFGNALDQEEYELIVQEIIYNEMTGQYEAVNINGVRADEDNQFNFDHQDDKVYSSSPINAGQGGSVTFNNVIKQPTGALNITKQQTEGAGLENEEFEFNVSLGDERIVSAAKYSLVPTIGVASATMVELIPIPVGTPYKVTNGSTTVTKYVEPAGIITLKVGETATFDGLVLGTDFEVSEILPSNVGYRVMNYKVVDEDDNNVGVATAHYASGTIAKQGQTVRVIVTNTPCELPATGGIGTQFYTFSGLLLMAIALVCGYRWKCKWEKEAEE